MWRGESRGVRGAVPREAHEARVRGVGSRAVRVAPQRQPRDARV